MPTSIIAGNWKMNTTVAEAKALASGIRERLGNAPGVTAVVCPPFVSLAAVKEVLDGSPIALGAQNTHPQDAGAFTGEVSVAMLSGLCDYAIIGHSERRQLFGEDDAFINAKTRAVLRAGLIPILCIGESLEDREGDNAEQVVEGQLRGGLADIETPGTLVVAYEPVWAIGTGRAATPDVAQSMMSHIRCVLTSLYGAPASDVPLLYGGSVNPGNVSEYMAQADVNGALVGGASLDADSFVDLVSKAAASAGA